MDFGPFKTEKRQDGMTMVRFPQGEPRLASNVEIFCFGYIEKLESVLVKIIDVHAALRECEPEQEAECNDALDSAIMVGVGLTF